MSRRPSTFRQQDVTRAIKAARAAGVTLSRVWIEGDGKIVLGIANYDEPETDCTNPWDKALRHEDQ